MKKTWFDAQRISKWGWVWFYRPHMILLWYIYWDWDGSISIFYIFSYLKCAYIFYFFHIWLYITFKPHDLRTSILYQSSMYHPYYIHNHPQPNSFCDGNHNEKNFNLCSSVLSFGWTDSTRFELLYYVLWVCINHFINVHYMVTPGT